MPGKIEDPVFVDTSIQIARKVHSPEIQKAIVDRLRNHREIFSGLVVRQEFKRRLLKEAVYLLKQLNERGSFEKVNRHVADHLPKPQDRKKRICLQMLMTVDEADSDEDRYDRARLMLRDLIKNGIATGEAHLTKINAESNCACAQQLIIEKRPFAKYEFGGDRCEKMAGRCGIRMFLESKRELLEKIYAYLRGLSADGQDGDKSDELREIESFIGRFLENSEGIENENPCLTVGDLLVALESTECPTIYTMNAKESQHLARVLKQSMVYRPPNSDRAEVECLSDNADWPKF
jgi:hypothetical protein